MRMTAIERRSLFGPPRPRRRISLPLERLNPVIRIAHRLHGPLHIPTRIIFDYELVLFLQGRGIFQVAGRTEKIEPGRLFLIAPFVPHRLNTRDEIPCEHIAVHFDFAARVVPGGARIDRRKPYQIVLEGGRVIPEVSRLAALDPRAEKLEQLVQARRRDPGAPGLGMLESRCLLLQILIQMLSDPDARRSPGADPVIRAKMQRALTYMDLHPAEKLTAATLAESAGFSRSHFNRLFRLWTGYSPMEYLLRQRVAMAKQLLLNIDRPIKQIARQLGFTDAFHFSRTFRRIDGLPPTEYRKAALAGRGEAQIK